MEAHPSTPNLTQPKSSSISLLPIIFAIISTILLLISIGINFFQFTENIKLQTKLQDQKEAVSSHSSTIPNDNSATINNPSSTNTPATKYLLLNDDDWDIKFTIPAGVTNIRYHITEDYDETLFITSITVGNKTYDLNLCGGDNTYRHYPFFLGQIIRWDVDDSHPSWITHPAHQKGLKLLTKHQDHEYYVNTNYGNGCATGDQNEDYQSALKLTKTLLESAQLK